MTPLRYYLLVDGPSLVLDGVQFTRPIELVAQPTYGRVLFTQHGAVIRNCHFQVVMPLDNP